MSGNTHYFKIGLFIIIAVLLGVSGIIIFGAGTLFEEKILMETYMDHSVQGLEVGSPVKYRGVKIGDVQDISFVSDVYHLDLNDPNYHEYSRYVYVLMAQDSCRFQGYTIERIKEELVAEVKAGLRVRLSSQGLTGVAFLESDYLDPERNPPLKIGWEPKHIYVPSAPSTFTRLTESVDKILQKLELLDIQGISGSAKNLINQLTQSVEEAEIGKLSGHAQELLVDLKGTNKNVVNLLQRVNPILTDAKATLASVRSIAQNAEEPLKKAIGEDVPSVTKNLDQIVKKVDKLSNEFPVVVKQIQDILHRMDNIVYNETENIEILIDNLKLFSQNLRELSENAKKYPSQILFGDPPERREVYSK